MGSSSSLPSKTPPPPACAQRSGGDLLKHAREQHGLTLAQLSSMTKIPQRHLEAIESGNLAALPGDFYRRAEIRTYARVVKVDQRLALAGFEQTLAAPAAAPPTVTAAPRQQVPLSTLSLSPKARAWVAFSVVSCAAALGFFMRGTGRPVNAPPARATIAPATADGGATPAVGREGDQPSAAPVAVGTSQTIAPSPASPQTAPAPIAPAPPADEQTTPSPAVNTATTLIINTDPQGARVTVNGIGWGATPVTIRHLDAGDKHIRVSHDGFAASERVVRLEEGQRRTLNLHLQQVP